MDYSLHIVAKYGLNSDCQCCDVMQGWKVTQKDTQLWPLDTAQKHHE